MEIRQVNEVHVYVLCLNTFGRAEEGTIAALSTDYNALVRFYNDQLCEKWRDETGFLHSFKKGSVLENLNPCNSLELNQLSIFGHGIRDEWVREYTFHRITSEYYFVEEDYGL